MGTAESTFLTTEPFGRGVIAHITQPKITEREAAILQQEIGEAAAGANYRVAVDIGEVEFLASAGIGTLINVHKLCKANRGKLVLFGVTEQLLQVLKLARLDRVFTIKPDAASAGKAVS
ncbi:MAG: STAS domain-containing protein [Planctomycetota bacterium]